MNQTEGTKVKKLAIVVGINSYAVRPLRYCVADADAIATTLEMPEYGYSVIRLLDNEATRYNLLTTLAEALEYQPDHFLFYFSGHGAVTSVGRYLVTHDGQPNDEGLDLSILSRYMERQSEVTAQVVSILDCCHSGSSLPWSETRFISPLDIEQGISTQTDTRVVMAACRQEEYSYEEPELKHGVFTYHLLDGLTGGAVNFEGAVTVGSLYDYVRPEVERAAKQRPLLRGDVGARVELGSGFPQRVGAPIPAEVRIRLLAEGQQLLDEYSEVAGRAQGRWKDSGHRESSQILTSTLRWFETQLARHPELTNDTEFDSLRLVLNNRVAQLGSMDVGTRVAHGILALKLGSGGFGSVWRVDKPDQGSVAMKVFHPADFGERGKLELFHRGYRAMARLDHPRVVSVHDYTQAPIGFYMDFIDGPNLRQLPELISDPSELLRILILTAETIQHAHGRGVVHRDIKPENILLSYDSSSSKWWPHLTDFDLAWFSTATSVTEKSFGNLYYAAPEQLAKPHSNAARNSAVDVYAFGQLVFFALTGSNPVPFSHSQNVAVMQDRLTGWSSGTVAHMVSNWYSRAIADEPSDRYPDFQSLTTELAAAEVAIRVQDPRIYLDEAVFLQEVAFGLSGFTMGEVTQGQTVRSLSGRTQMEFLLSEAPPVAGSRRLGLTAILRLDSLQMPGVTSERAKALLLTRVNAVLNGLPNVTRKSRTDGAFSTEIVFTSLTPSHEGVLYVREALGRVIDSMER